MVNKKAVAHSLLFTGIDGIGKSLFAESLAKRLLETETLKNHPDFYYYRPEGKLGLHSIPAMRQMCEKVYLPPFLAKKKVFIIENADKMLPASANALLKTLEEPTLDTTFILLSNQSAKILPTIISRCRTVRFSLISESEIVTFLINQLKCQEEKAKQLAALSGGSIGKALRMAQNESDLIRKELIGLFGGKKIQFYNELRKAAKSIAENVEQVKKDEEIRIKEELTKDYQTELAATTLQNVTKEVEAAVSIRQSDFAFSIFDFILSWFRDLYLLKNVGNLSYLMNKDCLNELKDSLNSRKVFSIEAVQKMIEEAELQMNRSTSLDIVLENLFLKLGLI